MADLTGGTITPRSTLTGGTVQAAPGTLTGGTVEVVEGEAPASYTHVQSQPAEVWTIAHNLGHYPIVQVRTLGGLVVDAEPQHLSEDVLQLRFKPPLAGSARLV